VNIAESWIHSIFGLVAWKMAISKSRGVIFGLGPLCSVANMRFTNLPPITTFSTFGNSTNSLSEREVDKVMIDYISLPYNKSLMMIVSQVLIPSNHLSSGSKSRGSTSLLSTTLNISPSSSSPSSYTAHKVFACSSTREERSSINSNCLNRRVLACPDIRWFKSDTVARARSCLVEA
jgi:hypothetical protein